MFKIFLSTERNFDLNNEQQLLNEDSFVADFNAFNSSNGSCKYFSNLNAIYFITKDTSSFLKFIDSLKYEFTLIETTVQNLKSLVYSHNSWRFSIFTDFIISVDQTIHIHITPVNGTRCIQTVKGLLFPLNDHNHNNYNHVFNSTNKTFIDVMYFRPEFALQFTSQLTSLYVRVISAQNGSTLLFHVLHIHAEDYVSRDSRKLEGTHPMCHLGDVSKCYKAHNIFNIFYTLYYSSFRQGSGLYNWCWLRTVLKLPYLPICFFMNPELSCINCINTTRSTEPYNKFQLLNHPQDFTAQLQTSLTRTAESNDTWKIKVKISSDVIKSFSLFILFLPKHFVKSIRVSTTKQLQTKTNVTASSRATSVPVAHSVVFYRLFNSRELIKTLNKTLNENVLRLQPLVSPIKILLNLSLQCLSFFTCSSRCFGCRMLAVSMLDNSMALQILLRFRTRLTTAHFTGKEFEEYEHERLCNCIVRRISPSFLLLFNVYNKIVFFTDCDINDANKGCKLYASPATKTTEHFVFIISPYKDEPIWFVHYFNYPLKFINSIVFYNHFKIIVRTNPTRLSYDDHGNVILTTIIATVRCKQGSPKLACSKLRQALTVHRLEVVYFVDCNDLNLKLNSNLHRHPELHCGNRHITSIISMKLSNDIETNPGPVTDNKVKLTLITQNCRGLGDINKTRLLLNKLHDYVNSGNAIAMLQETKICFDNYLKLAWRGKYVFTPGNGHSSGCITLLSHLVEVISIEHVEDKGHIITLKGIEGINEEVLVINIYAPNGFAANKTEFFEKIIERVTDWDGDIILAGDFNTTFGDQDRFKRGVSLAEDRLATILKNFIENENMVDTWGNKRGYTWRAGKIMSKLDRILVRLQHFTLVETFTDWTITTSDHAAVISVMKHADKIRNRNEHVKLDNTIITSPESFMEVNNYLLEQLASAQHMDPHTILEFAKMTLRTKVLEIMKRNKKRQILELAELNKDIKTNTELLTRHSDTNSQNILLHELEQLNSQKQALLQTQGLKLAQFAKTRWYNDGEKSNKYFLNLLKRRADRNEMNKLIVDGAALDDESEIRQAVTSFYSQLYNDNEAIEIDSTLFDNMFKVNDLQNAELSKPITKEELWFNLKSIRATTPGPDGISNTYIKKFWHIFGDLLVNAWNYSISTNELPPSHKTSLLRLIPKSGKDTTEIKNWRPITLSNCDHKLITRTYNNRILKIITNYITPTQTAYIKGRNIADNLRLLGSAVRLAEVEENINATVIALDAQKAFDSVKHEYLVEVLKQCNMPSFVPIFTLLYKDLSNDIIINGKIGKGYQIGNGVKQGDALSCSLFLLAIEPVIRNIMHNDHVRQITSTKIHFTWPKLISYADDITIITENNTHCVNAIFAEYNKLTKASGLKLNAEKTEKFNITSRNIVGAENVQNVNYAGRNYVLNAQDTIKINGIWFNSDHRVTRATNMDHMTSKMDKHFREWSKRGLSLIGKIQIIKTFGMSQYLYTLAVTGLEEYQWKKANQLIYKFIWNKNYDVSPAPHRIKKQIMLTETDKGGFGMADLELTVKASHIRRYHQVMSSMVHPIAELQITLGATDYFRSKPNLDIDDVTTSVMKTLTEHNLTALEQMGIQHEAIDTGLNYALLNSKITDLVTKPRSREMATLQRRQLLTLCDVLRSPGDSITLLYRICKPVLSRHIIALQNRPDIIIGNVEGRLNETIYDREKKTSIKISSLPSKQIRYILQHNYLLTTTKRLAVTTDQATKLYKNIVNLVSIQNKTKMLRLIHGDVYCGSRLKKFKLSTNDRCVRCFEEETIQHLLLECNYTKTIWSLLGWNPLTLFDIIGGLSSTQLEIAADIVSEVVFKKKVLPPTILIKNIYSAYAVGKCQKNSVMKLANNVLQMYNNTGSWHL